MVHVCMKGARSRLGRRGVVGGLLASVAVAAQFVLGIPAQAQDFPSADIRIAVTVPPGGQTDALARILGEGMARALNSNVIVENIGGAGGSLAAANVAQSKPDGYSMLLGTLGTQVVNPLIGKDLPYKLSDLDPVIYIGSAAAIIVANPAFEANNIAELIKMAKAKPGEIQYATSGIGTSGHLQGELLEYMAGIDMVAIHYRGAAPMMTDLIGGQIMLGVDGLPGQLANIKAGKLKALGMSDSKPAAQAPDIEPIANTVPGFEVTAWYGFYVPKGTPKEVVDKLNAAVNTALKDETVVKRLTDMGFRLTGGSPEELKTFQDAENAKWTPVIEKAGIKAE